MRALRQLSLCSFWTTCAALSGALHAGRPAKGRTEVVEVDSAGGITRHATAAAAVAGSPGAAASQEDQLRHQNAVLRRAFGSLVKENAAIRRLLLDQSADEKIRSEAALLSSSSDYDTNRSHVWLDGKETVTFFADKFGMKVSKITFALIFFFVLLASLLGAVVCFTGPGHDEKGQPVEGVEGLFLKLVHTFPVIALVLFGVVEFGILWKMGFLGDMYDKLIEYLALIVFAAGAICTLTVYLSRIIWHLAQGLADMAVQIEEQFVSYGRKLFSRWEGGLQTAKTTVSSSCGPSFFWRKRHTSEIAAPTSPASSDQKPHVLSKVLGKANVPKKPHEAK